MRFKTYLTEAQGFPPPSKWKLSFLTQLIDEHADNYIQEVYLGGSAAKMVRAAYFTGIDSGGRKHDGGWEFFIAVKNFKGKEIKNLVDDDAIDDELKAKMAKRFEKDDPANDTYHMCIISVEAALEGLAFDATVFDQIRDAEDLKDAAESHGAGEMYKLK